LKTAHLYREKPTDEGTFGYVAHMGEWWHSLELPNRDNKQNISSIHAGEYICKIRFSPHFQRVTFHLQDVKGRTYILIHSANFAGDVEKGWQSHLNGCIALGKGRGRVKNKFGKFQRAVLTSRAAVREFMEEIEDKEFKLIIEEL
jgi:Family of unknown function (DUF5675)